MEEKQSIIVIVWNYSRNWPRLRAECPCPRLRRWAILSLLNLCSSCRAHCRLLPAAAAPAPRPLSLSSKHLAWLLTPSVLSTLRTCPVRMATSASWLLLLHLCLPSSTCWYLARDVARSWTKQWISSEASPQAPKTHFRRGGKECSLAWTGPTSPSGTPP